MGDSSSESSSESFNSTFSPENSNPTDGSWEEGDDSDVLDDESLLNTTDDGPFIAVSKACQLGNVEELKTLIGEGKSVAVSDSRGWFPAHEAAAAGHAECLKVVLEQENFDVCQGTYDGETALHIAAKLGHTDCVLMLLAHKADPNKVDNNLDTPLHTALKSRKLECAKVLLAAEGIKVDHINLNGSTALSCAASCGSADIIRTLLDMGSDLTVLEDFWLTPVFIAAQFGHLESLRAMLVTAEERDQLLFVVNSDTADGASPLYIAAQEGHHDCIRLLLDNGADPTKALTFEKYTPLVPAVLKGHRKCVEMLWMSRETSVWEKLQPDLLVWAIDSEDTDMVEFLLKLGCNPDRRVTIDKLDSETGPHIFYTYLKPSFGGKLQLDYDKVSPVCMTIARRDEENTLRILKCMSSLEPESATECPIIYFALLHHMRGQAILTKLLRTYQVNLDYWYPEWLTGNLSVMLCLSRPHALVEVLKCGAEVDSVFGTGYRNDGTQTALGSLFNSPSFCSRAQLDTLVQEVTWDKSAVVRLLLEFTGNVRLDPNVEPTVGRDQWLKLSAITDNPRSLEHICRLAIRQCLGSGRLRSDEHVKSLGLPLNLTSYILYEDLCYEDIVDLMKT